MSKSQILAFASHRTAIAAATVFVSLTATTSVLAQTSDSLEEVVVTGFRRSLEDSTEAKRDSVGFVDAIFAEDIGKFPDVNLAESFNRIPGVTITRDVTGEGLNVAIRGLNTNFTRVLLNNAPVAIASTGQDNASVNREVDLDMFPSELFSQLSVAKTATAEMIEGGAAGTINMRMARPFDNEGKHFTYQIQGLDNNKSDDLGTRASVLASNTWDTFGVLVGVAGVRNRVATTGFETVGWTSLNLTPEQCGAATCNLTGGAGAGPGTLTTVPSNPSTLAAGLTPGTPIDQAFLLANNPGLNIQQLDNALIPRLGRPMFDEGTKDRLSGVVSLEFRPTEDMHLFLDSMYGKRTTDLERDDMMWGVRRTSQGGLVIPLNMAVDRTDCSAGCVATSGTFPNSQFLLEFRPYEDDVEFWGTNPGLSWQISDKIALDVQGNYTKSDFDRENPTVLAVSQPSTVTYTNNGGVPSIVSSIDLNNPANFSWLATNRGGGSEVGRVDMVGEHRETETKGGRASVTFGDNDLNLKIGGAYDTISRDIRPLSNTQQWQNAVCGGNPSVFVPAPNTQPACRGEATGEIVAGVNGYPTYPGLGTGYSAGMGSLTYGGSLITNASLPGFLRPTQYGFASVDWNSFQQASNYDQIHALQTETAATPTTASWGSITEDVTGLFTQLSGDASVGDNRLRYNLGVRWVRTDQSVISRLTAPDPRNVVPNTTPSVATADASRYPDVVNQVELGTRYENWLPSANLSWNVTEDFIVRAALSRTMTRPNPSDLLLGVSIPNADVSSVNLGNPELDPYLSDNLDFGFEYYTGAEGYFGVAAFRKGLEGFTTRQTTTVLFSDLAQYGITLGSLGAGQQQAIINRGGATAPVQLNQTVNASGRLTINGLEFNWVQPLDFLLERFGVTGLGFTANYTIIDQVGRGAAPAIAIGVPPETYNGTLYYDKGGVSARISVTSGQGSQASGPASNQSQITGAELFSDTYTQWDFSSSFNFADLFGWSGFVPQLTVDVINITEAKRRTFFQFSNATYSEFDSGRTVMIGLRGRF